MAPKRHIRGRREGERKGDVTTERGGGGETDATLLL